jgi:hypothetical protein
MQERSRLVEARPACPNRFCGYKAGSATADELDDFVAVVGSNWRGGPLRAREDFEVAFDGYAAERESEFSEEIFDRGARGHCATFAVDDDWEFVGHLSTEFTVSVYTFPPPANPAATNSGKAINPIPAETNGWSIPYCSVKRAFNM